MIVQRIAIVMYNYTHGLLPKVISDFYIKNNDVHSYNTRQRDFIHIPVGTHTHNFHYTSVLIWNELTRMNFDFSLSVYRFKNNLKQFLLHNNLNIGYTT